MEQNLKRMANENESQYIWRIGQAKDAGLLDYTWGELSPILNRELNIDETEWRGESAWRKKYRVMQQAYDDVFSRQQFDVDYISELQEQKREIDKARMKLQTEKIEYNRWLREEARDELIIEKITEAISQLDPLLSHHVTANAGDFMNMNNNKSWVLAISDAHFGTELIIKGLRNEVINEYNPEIFYRRMNDLFEQVMRIIQRENIGTLYIFDLGDQIDGILRVSQLMKLRYGVVESTIKYADWLARWLNDLSSCCKIIFRQTNGNHSELRMLGQKKGAFEEDNMGKVIYEFIKIRLADNLNVNIDQNETGFIFENIQGYNVLGYHGESKKLDTTMKDFEKIYKTDIDILVAGHLHHSYSETVGVCSDVMRTPSIIGIDDFSMKLHKTSNPGATMFCIEQGKGKVVEYNIKL